MISFTRRKTMYSFLNDYSEGAHPGILRIMLETNMLQTAGYGLDEYTKKATGFIAEKLGMGADIHFIPGGTQTNLIAAAAFLKPYEAVVSAAAGHVEVHEAGAIESTGHKILGVESADGKLSPGLIEPVLSAHTDEHMVKPRLVYISNSTELGTVYTKKELEALSQYCRQKNILLYLDGARLGSALCSSDLSLADIARLTDAFYIGGTKNGALLGEAFVICSEALKKDFRFHIKQRGAMLAKGRVMGIQFYELFRNGLYFELARHANAMADILRKALKDEGFRFMSDSPSNQVFPILPNRLIEKLLGEFEFMVWRKGGLESCVRLVTSWATPLEAAEAFADTLKRLNTAG
jgi:threonine aldolase